MAKVHTLYHRTFVVPLDPDATYDPDYYVVIQAFPHTVDVLGPSTPIHGPDAGNTPIHINIASYSSVHRVQYTYQWRFTVERDSDIENTPPTANPGGPYLGAASTSITFDGTGSFDPDGDPLTYAWDFGDGQTGTEATPSHSYTSADIYDVCLTVN
ncbi:MAG: PKD domain-containing protein, partial [Phycisphaerales bacterium]